MKMFSKKTIVVLMLSMLLVLSMGLPAWAATAKSTTGSLVTAVAEASIEVDPDIATVNLGVTTNNKDATTARQENTKKMNAVVAAVKKAGVVQKDIQTSNMSVYPSYDYEKSANTIVGYQVSNNVTVTIRKLDKLGDIINAGMGAGANNLYGVNFNLENQDEVKQKMLAQATQKAAAKAKAMATAAGLKTTTIASIVEGGASEYYYGYDRGGYMDLTGANEKPAATAESNIGDTIQVGTITISASVTVTYNAK